MKTLRDIVNEMKHSPSHNYVIPGLTSWLVGLPNPPHGCIRMFTMDRFHEEPIIPHSHRFDFRCLVLNGEVLNRTWYLSDILSGDPYNISRVTYEGTLGKHKKTSEGIKSFSHKDNVYKAGEEYGMLAEEFHSIYFSKGAEVLFFEGPSRLDTSEVLEPVVDNEVIPLFKTEKWMFRSDTQANT